MTTYKELLTVEFRYNGISDNFVSYNEKKYTIGIYDSFEDAEEAGNELLQQLSRFFEVRKDDKFGKKLFGIKNRQVNNICYNTNGVIYIARITTLKQCENIENEVERIFKNVNERKEFEIKEEE